MNAVGLAVTDGITIAKRNVTKLRRGPDLLGFVILSPVIFVLLFSYVFGSAIDMPGMSYREFLLPGIFVQTMIYGGSLTGNGLVDDLRNGIIDRYRSLPMSPAALLIGRTVSDLVTSAVTLVVMILMGLAVGWRIHSSPQAAAAGCLLLLLFSFAFSWLMATVGLAIRTPEVYSTASVLVIVPVSFIANTFVNSARLAGPLRVIADWNPASAFTQAARNFFGNTNAAVPVSPAWPLQHAALASVLWAALLLAVFVPLATWRYQKAVSR